MSEFDDGAEPRPISTPSLDRKIEAARRRAEAERAARRVPMSDPDFEIGDHAHGGGAAEPQT